MKLQTKQALFSFLMLIILPFSAQAHRPGNP